MWKNVCGGFGFVLAQMERQMTCIIGYTDGNNTWVGGDRMSSSGRSFGYRSKEPKVWSDGKWVFGFTYSWRMGQLLKHKLSLPKIYDRNIEEYMVGPFIDSVRDCFKEGGWAKKYNEQEEGGSFIVGYEGRLFTVWDNYQVSESMESFMSVGCGRKYALGAMDSEIYDERVSHKDKILLALATAAKFSPGVSDPFDVISNKRGLE